MVLVLANVDLLVLVGKWADPGGTAMPWVMLNVGHGGGGSGGGGGGDLLL